MRKLIFHLLICVVVFAAGAQDRVAVRYKVSNRDTDRGDVKTYEMMLASSPDKSLFYNIMSLYVDSCNSTPQGKAALEEIQMKAWTVVQPDGSVTLDGRKLGLAPDKNVDLYIEKDRVNNKMKVYDRKAGDLYQYEEPFGEQEWIIVEDSTKNILGFDCLFAYSDYHGRQWNVWFTPEIPIQDGPWKLYGLPGIILAADGGDDFVVEALEIGSTSQNIPAVYSEDDYEKGERRRILADHEHYINNFLSRLAAKGIKLNSDGGSSDLPKYDRKHRAWETDY